MDLTNIFIFFMTEKGDIFGEIFILPNNEFSEK